MVKDLIAVAKIRKSFGIKGEVIIEPLTHSLGRFKKLNSVFIGINDSNTVKQNIVSVRNNKNLIILKIDQVNDKTEADDLAGSFIYVDSKDAVKPPKGKYFQHEIIGLSVVDDKNQSFGTVKEIWNMPASDVYVIDYNGKEVLIPAVNEVVKKIDIESGKIIINIIDGLFEI